MEECKDCTDNGNDEAKTTETIETIETTEDLFVVDESLISVLLVVSVAAFVAAIAFTQHCAAQLDCVERGACQEVYVGSCTFRTAVAPLGFRMLNISSTSALTRGVCSPGMRQSIDSYGNMICTRALLYPDATSVEIQEPDAEDFHDRACGRWTDSGTATSTPVMFSFFDEPLVEHEVRDAIMSDVDVALSTSSDFARFRVACELEAENYAFAMAAENTYKYMISKFKHTFTSLDDALYMIGVLAGHYCLSPAAVALALNTNADFTLAVYAAGVAPSEETIVEALYAMGESSAVRERARKFAGEMKDSTQSASTVMANQVAYGSIADTWLSTSTAVTIGSVDSFVTLAPATSPSEDTMGGFVYATGQTSFEHARSYLKGVAALCSFDVRATITGDYGNNPEVAKSADTYDAKHSTRSRRKAAALGRLHVSDDAVDSFATEHATGRLSTISREHVERASRVTFADLRAVNYAGTTTSPRETCLDTAMRVFVDDFDSYALRKIAPDAPGDLESIVATLKTAVAAEITSGRTAALFSGEGVRASLNVDAQNTRVMIAGAPRGGPFGRAGQFTRPVLHSSDSSLTILIKQAYSTFLDRAELALEQRDTCQLPPLFEATARNAYLLTIAPCAMLLPGILVQPFYDHRYSEASMAMRIGYVIAHEVAHVGSDRSKWDEEVASVLLANYSESTWLEAAADLTAVDAVVGTGLVSTHELCMAVSQLWCARVLGLSMGTSHPGPNLRGDNACHWLAS